MDVKMNTTNNYGNLWVSGDKCIRQANDVEENPGPTILDIIDPTITVSADSSFVMSVTELKTKILTAFEN